jgi:hypothetical protein
MEYEIGCVAKDSAGCCMMTNNGEYDEDEYPNGADSQGICMNCHNLDDCEEYEEDEDEDPY